MSVVFWLHCTVFQSPIGQTTDLAAIAYTFMQKIYVIFPDIPIMKSLLLCGPFRLTEVGINNKLRATDHFSAKTRTLHLKYLNVKRINSYRNETKTDCV